jgi:hypothetical protein
MPFGRNMPRQRPGQPIAARTINQPAKASEDQSRSGVAGGMRQTTIDGVKQVWGRSLHRQMARITGAGVGSPAAYPWRGVYRSAGSWTDLHANASDRGGLDPVYEANDFALQVGDIVEMYRDPYTGTWVTQLDGC